MGFNGDRLGPYWGSEVPGQLHGLAISSDRYYIIDKRKETFRTETEQMEDCSLYRHIMRTKMIKKGIEAVGGTEEEGTSLSQKTHQSAKNLCSVVSPPSKRNYEHVKRH